MTRILVDPDQLRSLSVQLQRVSGDLQAVEGQLGGALGGLTWEARQKANLDTKASHARGQARELTTEVGKMSHYLERKAQMFDEADGRGVPSLLQLSRTHIDAVRGTPSWLRFPSRRVNALAGLGAVLGAASQIDVLHLPALAGMKVPWDSQQTYYGPSVPNVAYEGDPVNTATGNYCHQYTDLFIPTQGLPLAFVRTYNGLAPEDGPLGWGWRHTWQVTAEETDGDVRITYSDGRQVRFTWDGEAYIGDAGVFSTLTRIGDTFHLTEKDQTIYHFDAQGRLASVEDRNGNTTTLTYDTQDRLATVTEPAGRTLAFSYDSPVSDTLLTQITDIASRTVGFGYDDAGQLVGVTDVSGHATTYIYDADHRLLNAIDANGHSFVRNVYDANGRVVEQYDADDNVWIFVYDEVDRRTLVTDPLGHTTTYQYDDKLRLIAETDALDQTLSYTYDADNNRTQAVDKRGYATHYVYDDRGNTTVITDAVGSTRSFTYDSRNNLVRHTDQRGHTTLYTYDTSCNLIAREDPLGNVVRWAYDAHGQLTSQTDALGRVTRFAHDTYGHQTAITDALGNATTFTYDIVGRRLTTTDAKERTVTYTYDDANRVLTVSEPLGKVTAYGYDAVGNRTVITNPRGGVTTHSYDAKDRLISVTDPLNHTVQYGYDALDNQTVVTNALGHPTYYAYDALNRRTAVTDPLGNTMTYTYDPNGNRTSVTDANGNVTRYSYDPLNRLISVTDAGGGTVTYTYDASGNRVSMTDANDHTTKYGYDALDRLVSETDPLVHTTVYTYDAVGNHVAQQKPDGTTIIRTYDTLDRLVGINAPDLDVGYTYDASGNRTVMTDATGITTYTYDDLDRLRQVAAPTGTLQYDYDLNGNRTRFTYPGGEVVMYSYDLADQLTSVIDWAGQTTAYSYDAAGRQTQIQYPNSIEARYAYDEADRLTSITHTSAVSGVIASFAYTLDAAGNRTAMVDLEGTTTYAYDDLDRLTEVTYPDGETVTYAYDPMGNRTAMTSTVEGATGYTYDAAHRLLTAGSDTFGWDANGRMITRTYGVTTATYAYDPLDRLTEVVSGTTTVAFTYNGDGVRVGKNVNGTNTDYVQDVAGSLPMVVAETSDGQTSGYIYGNDLIAQIDPTANPTFYHQDGLGSVRALSNPAGQRRDAYSYRAFGEIRSHTGGTDQAFTFTGEQVDDKLCLVYLRLRYYDPSLGRFLTRDQFEGFRDRTQSRHRYVYVENNPIIRVDPSGLTWQVFGGLEGGLMLGPIIRVGGGLKTSLEFNEGLPDTYISGSGGTKAGLGLDAELGPKVGVKYVHDGGIGVLPSWLQIKGGTIKLPFSKIGGTVTREELKILLTVRTGVGFAIVPQVGAEAQLKSGNLKGKLGDWIFDYFVQPHYDARHDRIMAEHHRRMLEIQPSYQRGGGGGGGGAGGRMGSPPSGGK